jgi:hypothetical protein
MSGVVGGLIFIVIGVPLTLLLGSLMSNLIAEIVSNFDSSIARQIRFQQATQTIPGTILRSLIGAFFLLLFSTVGGLIGVAVFEKRKDGSVAPPPQNFGGGPGGPGGYGAGV